MAEDYYDITDMVYIEGSAEADRRRMKGHLVIQLPPHDSTRVYFQADRERVGDTWAKAIAEAQGKVFVASTTTEEFLPYSSAPDNFWKIENGQFVKLFTPEQIDEYNNDMKRISEDRSQLSAMDYKTNKWVEGELTEEEWNAVKAQRSALRAEINILEDKWGFNKE